MISEPSKGLLAAPAPLVAGQTHAMTRSSSRGDSGGWWRGGRTAPPEALVLDIPTAAAVDTEDDSSLEEEGEDGLGNHNLAEYRAAWQRGENDTTRSVGSGAAAAAAAAEEEASSSASGPHAALGATGARSAAAGDVVVQARDFI